MLIADMKIINTLNGHFERNQEILKFNVFTT